MVATMPGVVFYLGSAVTDAKAGASGGEDNVEIQIVAPGGDSLLNRLEIIGDTGGDLDLVPGLSFQQLAERGAADV